MTPYFMVVAFAFYLPLFRVAVAQNIPSLVYNCDKMPAICKNVNQYFLTEGNSIDSRGLLRYSEILHRGDPNDPGRRIACPADWALKHKCPEPDQPLIVPRGSTVTHGGFPGDTAIVDQVFGDAWLKNAQGTFIDRTGNVVPKSSPVSNGKYNLIINRNTGQYTGLLFSCDEC